MGYVDYEYYTSLYGSESADELAFNRFEWEARRIVDNLTTGVDGVKKLKIAFPADEDDAEAVKRCMCNLIDTMHQIREAETELSQAAGYEIDETTGAMVGKIVSSKSAGNESISFATGSNARSGTEIDKAVSDRSIRDTLYRSIITDGLSGINDANGVNLLYMGRYPHRVG